MIKFPSIEQFRNVVRKVSDKAQFVGLDAAGDPIFNKLALRPKLQFQGTVKLHGTNAAIVWNEGAISFQSRERILTLDADNACFMSHFIDGKGVSVIESVLQALNKPLIEIGTLAVYGEWCGGNIQKGVAITGLPKMFVIFAVKLDEKWQDMESIQGFSIPEHGVFNIMQFPTFNREIDFENPAEDQNGLIEFTNQVEAECPVGKHFGVSGIGEGIVWRCLTPGWDSSDYWFKVKGEKHSATKVTKLAEVDVESVAAINEFVARTVTEQRCEQGLQNLTNEMLKPFEMQSIGDFLRWIFADIMKEEADTIEASGFNQKSLGGPIAKAAKRWYMERLNNLELA